MDEMGRLQRGFAVLNEDKSEKPRRSDQAKFEEFQKKLMAR